jgi:4-amino-4-deoxy-L-arabinose transferase-like glycosyltransferase
MYRLLPVRLWVFLIWAILIAVSLYTRPLLPIDETRYAAVAWEMWFRNDFLVPHLNGESYSHKPPLLFWLIALSWKLFGVNEMSLRLISPLFSLAALYLSGSIARVLWPDRSKTAELAPLLLLGSLIWTVYSTLTMFDMMLAFFVMLGIYSLTKLGGSAGSIKYWILLGIAIGGGILSKGPVVLLHLLPVALLAPWWLTAKPSGFRWSQWYGRLFFSFTLGALIALGWAVPAGYSGGEAYRNAIFLGQTSGRLVESFAHQYPWWWYLQVLPLLLLPWLLVKPLWTGLKKLTLQDRGVRFCAAWIVPVFLAFSLVSGKRIHYLLPLIPAFILIAARAADTAAEEKGWEKALRPIVSIYAVLGLVLACLPWLSGKLHGPEDLSPLSPAWGILLLTSAVLLGLSKAANATQSVFYTVLASVAALILISCGFFSLKARGFDTMEPAQQISKLMAEQKDIAYYGSKYHGQYHFNGRLNRPIAAISLYPDLYRWAKGHPDAYIIVDYRETDALPKSIFSYSYPCKSHKVGLMSSKVLLENPNLKTDLHPY